MFEAYKIFFINLLILYRSDALHKIWEASLIRKIMNYTVCVLNTIFLQFYEGEYIIKMNILSNLNCFDNISMYTHTNMNSHI